MKNHKLRVKEFVTVSNRIGGLKTAVYFVLLGLSLWGIIASGNVWLTLLFQMLLGLVFAHGLELQHEALHHILVSNKRLNAFLGFLFGLPMCVSYTHYRVQHLHHHKYLGTDEDEEIFDYEEESLTRIHLLLIRAFNVARIPALFRNLINFIRGEFPVSFRESKDKCYVLMEYLLIVLLLSGTLAYSVIYRDLFFLVTWYIPWLVFGEIFHFLIELPEHIHCKKDSPDIYKNTRTIVSRNPFILYIVNGNNYHVEHHLTPNVVIHNLKNVHSQISDRIEYKDQGYRRFYSQLLKQTLLKK